MWTSWIAAQLAPVFVAKTAGDRRDCIGVDAFMNIGDGLLDVFQQRLTAVFAFVEPGLEGLLALGAPAGDAIPCAPPPSDDRRRPDRKIVGAFLQQTGGPVLGAAFVRPPRDDRNILAGLATISRIPRGSAGFHPNRSRIRSRVGNRWRCGRFPSGRSRSVRSDSHRRPESGRYGQCRIESDPMMSRLMTEGLDTRTHLC